MKKEKHTHDSQGHCWDSKPNEECTHNFSLGKGGCTKCGIDYEKFTNEDKPTESMENKIIIPSSKMSGKTTEQALQLFAEIREGKKYVIYEMIDNRVHILPDKKLKELIRKEKARDKEERGSCAYCGGDNFSLREIGQVAEEAKQNTLAKLILELEGMKSEIKKPSHFIVLEAMEKLYNTAYNLAIDTAINIIKKAKG